MAGNKSRKRESNILLGEEEEDKKKGFDPTRKPGLMSKADPTGFDPTRKTKPVSEEPTGFDPTRKPGTDRAPQSKPKKPEKPKEPKMSGGKKEGEFDYPKFVEGLGADAPPRSSQIMRDAFLRPGTKGLVRMSRETPETRLEAYRGLAARRTQVPDWFPDDAFSRGAIFRLWDEIEQTVEKYSDKDFPDVPEYGHDPESTAEELGMYASLLLAGVATATVATAAGPYIAGALGAIPGGGVAAAATSPLARLVLGRPFVFAALSGAALREGTEETPPEDRYGFAASLTPLGKETPEEKERRMTQYPQLSYGGRLVSQLKGELIDEAAFWGAFKGVKFGIGGAKRLLGGPQISAKSTGKANSVLAGHEEEWVKEHGDSLGGVSLEEAENFVAKSGAAMQITSNVDKKLVKTTMKTSEGKKLLIAYRKLTDDLPPPKEDLIKKPARIAVGPDMKGTSRKVMKHILKGGDTQSLNKLRTEFLEAASNAGDEAFDASVANYTERAVMGIYRNMVKAIRKGGAEADLGDMRQQLAIVEGMLEDGLTAAGKKAKDLPATSQKSLEVFRNLRERLSGTTLDIEELQKMPPNYLDFLDNMYKGLADGTVDADSVKALISVGGVKGMLQFAGRAAADNMLGATAVLSTLAGNVAGTADEFIRNSKLYGARTAALDNYQGLMNVSRLVGKGMVHPLESTKNLYLRITGQSVDHAIHGRALIEETLPQNMFSKLGNALTGWRFEAIHGIDAVTKAYNAQSQARKAVAWMTDHRLKEAGIVNPSKAVYQKEYRKVLAEAYQEFAGQGTDSGVVPLFMHITQENMDKLALRRNLAQKNLTPLGGGSFFNSAAKTVDNFTLQKPDDSLMKATAKWGARTLLVPFSKTGLNVAERNTYAAEGLLGKTKNVGYFENLDRKAAAEAMSIGYMLYAAEQMYDHGVLEMAEPYGPHQDPIKGEGTKTGIPQGHFKVGNRTLGADKVNVYGAGMMAAHHIHGLMKMFEEDDPTAMEVAQKALSDFGRTFGPLDLIANVSEFASSIDAESQSNKARAAKAGSRWVDRRVETMMPLSKSFKNVRELYKGQKIGVYEPEEPPSEKAQKEALDKLNGVWEYLKVRATNAYGTHAGIQRDYFGRPVKTMHPEEFGGDEGWQAQMARFAIGGTGVVDEESVKFYEKMSEIGLFDMSGTPIETGPDSPSVKSAYVFNPVGKSVTAMANIPDERGRPRGKSMSVKLPYHKFTQKKGLMGLQEDVWVDFVQNLPSDKEKRIAIQRYGAFVRTMSKFGYQDGDDLYDVMRRIALYEGDKRNAPRELRIHWNFTESAADIEGGGNMLVTARGDAKEYMLNQAKRKTIVTLYNFAKTVSNQMMAMDPYVRKQANTLHTATEGRRGTGTAVRDTDL